MTLQATDLPTTNLHTTIKQASDEHHQALVRLFDQYRMFYGQASNLNRANQFISKRILNKDSLILLATNENNSVLGFLQIYPTFSSIQTGEVWLINDLYVDEKYRGNGVARLLIKRAVEVATMSGIQMIRISTERTNQPAQNLYESLGFNEDERFIHYNLPVTQASGLDKPATGSEKELEHHAEA